MKRDINRHEERWQNWKKAATQHGIADVSSTNSAVILQYLADMELGLNVAADSSKGPRTPARLTILRDRTVFFAKQFAARFGLDDLRCVTEEQLLTLFAELGNGTIRSAQGKPYQSVDTLANVFKAFWHWHQRVSRKQGVTVRDITVDLAASGKKPKWVYLNEAQAFALSDAARFDYRVLITFIYDTGIRPSEVIHLKRSDLYEDFKELHIRDEIAKKGSFGRRIKLMLCRDLLRKHCTINELEPNDYLFSIKPFSANKYIKRVAKKLFGDELSAAGKRYSDITLYDLRHNSCCYWLPRYKSESALKYRFGWKRSEMIHYYSELLGMRDTISEEDLLIDVSKTELERRLVTVERENGLLKERLSAMEQSFQAVDQLSRQLEQAARLVAEQKRCAQPEVAASRS